MDLKRVIKINRGITLFNEAFAGATIVMLLGAVDAAVLMGLLRVTGVAAKCCAGAIQSRYSSMEVNSLFKLCYKVELISTIIYATGNIIVAYNFNLGVSLLLIGRVTHSIRSALSDIKQEHLIENITDGTVTGRSAWRGELKSSSNVYGTIGLICNIAVFIILAKFNISGVDSYKLVLVAHGIMGYVDLYISKVELDMTNFIYQ